MKNPEKQFFKAIKLMKLATYPTLETGRYCLLGKRDIDNIGLYKIGERMFIEAQEEMNRQNKQKIIN